MVDARDFEQKQFNSENFDEEVLNTEDRKRSRYEGMPLLTIVQITLCIMIIAAAFALKLLGGDLFIRTRGWYLEHLNDPIIAGDNIDFKEDRSNKHVKNVAFNVSNDKNVLKVSIPMCKPLDEGKLTSRFGFRKDPFTGEEKGHGGIDIGASCNSPIHSVLSGKVEKADVSSSYGKYVLINHGNNIKTLYAHCNELKVVEGQDVKRGDEIAFLGSTGRSTGNHLHFEIKVNEIRYNPEPFFKDFYV